MTIVSIKFDHQALVSEGIWILSAIYETSAYEKNPFALVGDPK